MVCTADDLLGWKDFPKGLRVLLLDEDSISSAEIKSKLEEMDYIVSTFCNENEALTEISNRPESFHVAIVEVSTGDKQGSFKFLETVKNLPTIMISDIHCLSTMMKCIALGATEFLQKPLSEEKLRNIWQHVAHKAFNAGGSTISEPSKPIKETEVSMLHLQEETSEPENQNLLETENAAHALECDHEHSTISDKFPAPSTPQLKQGCRLLDYGDCQDQPNCSIEKEHGEEEGDSKSVETTCNNSVVEITVKVDPSSMPTEVVVKDEDSLESSKTTSNLSPHSQNKDGAADSNIMVENPKKASLHTNSSGNRASRKKIKVDWTPELHKRFVQAVEQLGIDQAIPSRILDLMKVDGLTRHNVASHLQKYRMHKRHIMPKEDDRRWRHPRDTMQRVYPQKPIMAYPPYHSNHGVPPSQFYPVWGHPSCQPSGIQMWGHHPGYPMWQAPESWLWNTNQGMHVDAWGCPVMPPSQTPFSTFPQVQNGSGFYGMDDGSSMLKNSFDLNPAEEVIDRVVKEAMSKPWQPLPLGLKPPSTESVLSELHRQGICEVPPESQC